MSSQNLTKQLPHNIFVHPYEIGDLYANIQGVIDAELKFDKFFLLGTLTHRYIKQILGGKKAGLLDKSRVGFVRNSDGIEIKEDLLHKMERLWVGNTFLVIDKNQRHPEKWQGAEVWLRPPKRDELKFNQECLKLPALKHLKPMNDIHGVSLLVHISETVPVKDGLRDVDVTQLALSGGMVYPYADGLVPIFKSKEEILNSKKRAYWVGRPYYYSVTNILQEVYLDNFSDFCAESHIIINKLTFGDGTAYQKQRTPDVTPLW